MSDLMFNRVEMTRDGSLRHWDIAGPAGLVRFETAGALGFKTASVYLHSAVAPPGGELEDCGVCGTCWSYAMGGRYARELRAAWESAGEDDDVIRTQLERWYAEEIESTGRTV